MIKHLKWNKPDFESRNGLLIGYCNSLLTYQNVTIENFLMTQLNNM